MSILAYITPKIIEWGRERAGLSVEELADRLDVQPRNVREWEDGRARPNLNKAEDIAGRLRIPFGYLFLSRPPEDEVPLPDLRTVSGHRPENPSLDFIEVIQSTLLKQEWYSEYLQQSEGPRLPFVGSARLGSDVKITAGQIRERLGIDKQMLEQCTSWQKFKVEFVRRAESIGVLVMQSGVSGNNQRRLSVEEFRGFAIVDKFAPVVFINARDAKSAKIFTLAHELVHVWLGEAGVSNPDPQKRSSDEANEIERFCNRVAAELLVPSEAVLEVWKERKSVDQKIRRLVREYRVSKYVVARQAFEMDRLTRSEYLEYLDQHKSLWLPEQRDDESDGNFYNTFAARNSITLIAGVVQALGQNRISYRDASTLLAVRVGTLKKVADRLG
jgi:Zn-dependent peptidase ImmA (M78 family)/transcriptional regulator with XRE-family HTH domain